MNEQSAWLPYKEVMAEALSYVRLLHAVPGGPAVDVYANGNIIARGLTYGKMTEYTPVNPGVYNIQVFAAGQTSNPIISSGLRIPPESTMTVTAVGEEGKPALLSIREVYMPVLDRRNAYLRFANLAPDMPALEITLPDGTKLFRDVCYRGYSDYISLPPGNYTLLAKDMESERVLFRIPNINLAPGTLSTLYVTGSLSGEPPVDALLFNDGVY